jgi:hypothetical protein
LKISISNEKRPRLPNLIKFFFFEKSGWTSQTALTAGSSGLIISWPILKSKGLKCVLDQILAGPVHDSTGRSGFFTMTKTTL